MDLLTDELFSVPNTRAVAIVVVRLVALVCMAACSALNAKRVEKQRASGHICSSPSARRCLSSPAQAGLGAGDLGPDHSRGRRGIGFIGAGTILKLTDREEIKGLTTAASIWLTAAPVSQRPSVHCGCRLSARLCLGRSPVSHTSKQNQPPSPRAIMWANGSARPVESRPAWKPRYLGKFCQAQYLPGEGLAVDDPRWIALHAGPVARRRPRVLGPAGLHSMCGRRLADAPKSSFCS